MKKSLFILLSLASVSAFSNVKVYNLFDDVIPESNNRTRICTMTINSPAEKLAYIEQSKKMKEEVDYIELTPNNTEFQRNTWLKSVCSQLTKKKVSCDKLILSAHFGPRLYGDSRKEIDLDYLESLSCSSSCASLFSKLKETYLYTCNSMSGSADDKRRSESAAGLLSTERNSTRQNYVAVQIAHEASRSWAEEAAEARYGNYSEGGMFGERFLMAFGNSMPKHQVYGFTSVSNIGVNNAKYIRQAFAQKRPIEEVMKSQKMVKRSGFLSVEDQSTKRWSCQMMTKRPEEVAPALIKEVATPRPEHRRLYGRLIRFVMDYFTPHHKYREDEIVRPFMTEYAWFKTLQKNTEIKNFVMSALKTKEFPSSFRMRWSTLAYNLAWISQNEHYSNLSKAMYGLMKPPYNAETRDDVLHYAKLFPDAVSAMGPVPTELKNNNESRYKVEELMGLLKGR